MVGPDKLDFFEISDVHYDMMGPGEAAVQMSVEVIYNGQHYQIKSHAIGITHIAHDIRAAAAPPTRSYPEDMSGVVGGSAGGPDGTISDVISDVSADADVIFGPAISTNPESEGGGGAAEPSPKRPCPS
eukprot:3895013-Pyramimonas_sp.AAC.1